MMNNSEISNWEVRVLQAAAIYNVAWGSLVICFPFLLFDLSGLERPNYPEIWQCVGMIVGVYGLGYWIAASNPKQHWPIILVGFLGKILGPIGFIKAIIDQRFNGLFAINILFNDIIWWVPFGLIIWKYRLQNLLTPKRK